jgi:hypothetical protein
MLEVSMIKEGGMESAETKDSATGREVLVSTTVRLLFRKMFPEKYGSMRNARLNEVIVEDFVRNAGNVRHYFRLGSKDSSGTAHRGTAEIRTGSIASLYYISAIRKDTIDILTVQSDWFRPKFKGSSGEAFSPDETGRV